MTIAAILSSAFSLYAHRSRFQYRLDLFSESSIVTALSFRSNAVRSSPQFKRRVLRASLRDCRRAGHLDNCSRVNCRPDTAVAACRTFVGPSFTSCMTEWMNLEVLMPKSMAVMMLAANSIPVEKETESYWTRWVNSTCELSPVILGGMEERFWKNRKLPVGSKIFEH